MDAVGIGGVEINTISQAPNVTDADVAKYPVRPWLSEGWLSAVKVALEETKRRGMTADLIVGSGWPSAGVS